MASNAPHPRGTPGPPTTAAPATAPASVAMPDTGGPPQMTNTTSPAGPAAPPSSTPLPTSAHLAPSGTGTGGVPIPPPPPPAAPPVATPAGGSTPPSSGPSAATQAAAVAMVAHGQGMQGMAAEDWAAGFVTGHGLPLADANGAENRPTLNVRDALAYLEEVKRQFADRIEVYNLFLDIMKDFKSSRLSTPEVITRVSSLFDGHPALITGFNTFLPAGYRIELTGDPTHPMRVITPEGTTTTRALLAFDVQSGRPASGPAALASLASLAPSPSTNTSTLLPRPASAASGLGGTGTPNAPQGGMPGSHLAAGTPPAANLDPMAPFHGYGQPLQMPQQAGGAPSAGAAPAAGTPPAVPGTVPATLMYSNVPGQHVSAAAAAAAVAMATPPAVATPGHQPLDFGQAISFVNKIKNSYKDRPEVYKTFLEILTNYQRDNRAVEEVNEQVLNLFQGAPHLIEEFKLFLPAARHLPSSTGPMMMGAATPLPGASAAPRAGDSNVVQVFSATPRSGTPPNYPVAPNTDAGAPPTSAAAAITPASSKKRKADSGSATAGSSAAATPVAGTGKSKKKQRTDAAAAAVATATGGAAPYWDAPSAGGAPSAGAPAPVATSAAAAASSDEMELFDRIKRRINSPAMFQDFLKVLHLYAQDVLSHAALLDRVHAFLGARAPDLYKAFTDLFGAPDPAPATHFVLQPAIPDEFHPMGTAAMEPFTGFAKYSMPDGMDTWQCVGPSYRRIRKDIKVGACSGRDALGRSVLNDDYVSHPPTHSDANAEDQLNVHKRNPFEEQMSRVEEERYEFDVNIEANAAFIRLLEPIAQKMATMSDADRRGFRLPANLGSSTPSVHQRILKKLYGENAPQVMEALSTTPAVAVPIVLKRLKQKDDEWRRQKREFAKVWRESDSKNFYRALDYQGVALKTNERRFHVKTLVQEIEASYVEAKERRILHRAVVQHHLEVAVHDRSVIADVYNLLAVPNDAHQFARFRPFLDNLFFSELDPTPSTAAGNGSTAPATHGLSASASKRKSARKAVQPVSSVVCFGNNHLYILVRLVLLLAGRLEMVKRRARELAQNPDHARVNPVAIELGFQPAPTPEQVAARDPTTYYAATLRYLTQQLRGQLDAPRFEELARGMYGTAAYHVFGMDKVIQATLKHAKEAHGDANTRKLVALFVPPSNSAGNAAPTAANGAALPSSATAALASSSTTANGAGSPPPAPATAAARARGLAAAMAGNRYHQETLYRLSAEEIVAKAPPSQSDHVYRIEFHHQTVPPTSASARARKNAAPYLLTVQLLSAQDFVSGDEAQWTHYVEEYTMAAQGNSHADPRGAALAAAAAAEAAAAVTVAADTTAPGPAARRPFLLRSLRRGLGAPPRADLVHAHGGLQLKICVNTYRLFYIADTEDFFVRRDRAFPLVAANTENPDGLVVAVKAQSGAAADMHPDVAVLDTAPLARVVRNLTRPPPGAAGVGEEKCRAWLRGEVPARPHVVTQVDPEWDVYRTVPRARAMASASAAVQVAAQEPQAMDVDAAPPNASDARGTAP